MNNLKNNKNEIFLSFFVFIYFSIILFSGYFSDDAYSSQIKGILAYEDKNLFNYTTKTIFGWVIGSGRLLILNQFQYLIFYLIENIYLYKLFIIVLLIINFQLFYKLNNKIINSQTYSLYIAIFSVLSIQLREFHDPVLGFHGFMIVLSILFLSQILLLIKYIENQNKSLLYISLTIFTICHLMYELAFTFLFLNFFLLQIRNSDFKKNINILKKYFFIFITIIFIFLLLQFRVNYFSSNQAPDYKIFTNILNILSFVEVLFIQITSAIPTIYFFSIINEIIFDKFLIFFFLLITSTFFLLILISNKVQLIKNLENKKISIKNKKNILVYSVLLYCLPAFIILVSSHNEHLLTRGIGYGYIFNFVSCYGFGYVVYCCLINFDKLNKFLISGLIMILFFLNTFSNINTVLKSNIIYKYPEQLFFDASKKGLFYDLNDKSILIRHMKYPSDFKWNFYSKLKKKLNILDVVNISKKNLSDVIFEGNQNDLGNNQYEIKFLKNKIWASHYFYDHKGRQNGQYILAEIENLVYEKQTNKIIKLETRNLKVYQQHKNKIYLVNLNENIDFIKIIFQKNQNPVKYFLHFDLYQY
tara:strand:+ start:642 stop:2402 length:1761 start_codon:yes stop_codon:yes gene_type:complete